MLSKTVHVDNSSTLRVRRLGAHHVSNRARGTLLPETRRGTVASAHKGGLVGQPDWPPTPPPHGFSHRCVWIQASIAGEALTVTSRSTAEGVLSQHKPIRVCGDKTRNLPCLAGDGNWVWNAVALSCSTVTSAHGRELSPGLSLSVARRSPNPLGEDSRRAPRDRLLGIQSV